MRLAFRFSAIDRLPEPPTVAATRGTLVHAALEALHCLAPADRTPEAALACLDDAALALRDDPEYIGLGLDDEAAAGFQAEAADLVRNYFRLEDPTTVRAIGLELRVEAEVDGIRLRGIIDRLELDADGELVVTDYKTGGAPSTQYERKRLSGVHIYSLLCEELLGRRPRTVQLLYLKEPLALTTTPSDRSTRGTRRTLGAVWQAVERACEREDFRPQPSRLCTYCAFQAYCPTLRRRPRRGPAPRRAARGRARRRSPPRRRVGSPAHECAPPRGHQGDRRGSTPRSTPGSTGCAATPTSTG